MLAAITVQPKMKKVVEMKGIIGDSKGKIGVIHPARNKTSDGIPKTDLC
ncbi:hypothetical protein GOM44_02635 [Wolbachia endosymbiont of Atemnus politus]|nr:hypothetical protein [Wolbachia endosymbiont of Atemnus politus]